MQAMQGGAAVTGIDRAAVIDAAARAIHARYCTGTDGLPPSTADIQQASAVVDVVLPLIADAIEDPIRLGEAVHYEFCSLAQAGALVRALSQDGGNPE